MRALVLCGSVSPQSCTRAAARGAADMLCRQSVECEVWDFRERPLPFADPAYHDDPSLHPDPMVRRFVEAADEADGFLLASPVYHNTYSGVLKNSLDNLTIAQFRYKPVGLVAFGGSMSAIQVCDHLRIVVRGLYGIALPIQVVTTPTDFTAGENGALCLTNPAVLDRFEMLARDFVLFAHLRKGTLKRDDRVDGDDKIDAALR
jgi:azobenzene reductase